MLCRKNMSYYAPVAVKKRGLKTLSALKNVHKRAMSNPAFHAILKYFHNKLGYFKNK
jgi:hypothetical protein